MRERFIFLLCILLGYSSKVKPFLVKPEPQSRRVVSRTIHAGEDGPSRYSSNDRPLYDGTNYTFPDTRTPSGVAQMLEVSFVHGCMQLAKGYVDVLKMFIAASVAAYEFGFPLSIIEDELGKCKNSTANRPLLEEEVSLRRNWYSLVYLTLAAMDHKTHAGEALAASVSREIHDRYGDMVEQVGLAYKKGTAESLSVDGLINAFADTSKMSELEKAVLSQSLRVVTLTPVVVRESLEARGEDIHPPTPPIEGAFQ